MKNRIKTLKKIKKILKDSLEIQKEINEKTREYLNILQLIEDSKHRSSIPDIPITPNIPPISPYPTWISSPLSGEVRNDGIDSSTTLTYREDKLSDG